MKDRAIDTGTLAYFGPEMNHVAQIRARYPKLHLFQFDFFAPGYYYDKLTIKADIQSIPLQSQSLDHVIVLHVLEHVPSLQKALTELARVVVPGGTIYHETPCDKRTKHNVPNNTYCPPTKRTEGACTQKDHLWSYSCRYLKQQLRGHGFECKPSPFEASINVTYYNIPEWNPVLPLACEHVRQIQRVL